MRTAQQYKDLGIPSWYHDHARYYERLFTNVGWSDQQVEQALRFGATYQGDGTEEHLTKQFREMAAVIDAPDVDLTVDVGLGLRDNIWSGGIESLPVLEGVEPGFTSADEARLAAIREIARNDPRGYEANTALQNEQLALLEAQQAGGGKVSAGGADASAAPSGDRLAQIREMRRNDPQAYDSDHKLQAEELSLIEASLPASTVEVATPAATSSTPAETGISND